MSEEIKLGRPPVFTTPAELHESVEAYFESCVPEPIYYDGPNGEKVVATNKDGVPVLINHPPTISGLAYSLGFVSRQSLYDYKNRSKAFSYIIKRAKLRIEANHEENLSTRDKPTGDIFWMKNNAGYADKQEVEHSGSVTIIDDIPKAKP